MPESWACIRPAELRASPGDAGASLGTLAPGDRFAALEVSGAWAWGYRERDRTVGYVRAEALSMS